MINNLPNILTQNHLCTAEPIYTVYSKQEICVDGDFEFDKIIYVKNDDDSYPELTYEEFEELESEYNRATDYRTIEIDSDGVQVIREIPKDPCSGDDFNPDDWEERYIKFVDKFEQVFFIRQNAEDFIAANGHRMQDAFVYVESAYRNPEWQAIRKMLVDAAKKNENKFGELKFGLKYEDIVDGMFVVYSELPFSNYANSLKRIWKTESGWREQTFAVEWKGEYQESDNVWDCGHKWVWNEKNYAPVDYDGKTLPVEFINKNLPLTIKGEQDA